MVKKNIQISIITLNKNEDKKFLKTLRSIKQQDITFKFEWLLIDGSNNLSQKKKKSLTKNHLKRLLNNKIIFRHINSELINLKGIYECMNYGKKISKGEFIIFLNSGDIFHSKNSLQLLFDNSLDVNKKKGLIFGQANIFGPNNINWYFPGNKLKNIQKWLDFFEPNHQSMLVSKELAKKFDFPLDYNSIGDGLWKRRIIDNAIDIKYIKTPIVKFFLDGISSTKPSKKLIKDILKNKKISLIRKSIFLIKYLFPSKMFYLYNLFQKYKSLIVDLIF